VRPRLGLSSYKEFITVGPARDSDQSQWPQIKADLDRGMPVALGLVMVASRTPADLSLNHQVAGCG
jgi:hypothetical protein